METIKNLQENVLDEPISFSAKFMSLGVLSFSFLSRVTFR